MFTAWSSHYFVLWLFTAFTPRVRFLYILAVFCIVGIYNIHTMCSIFYTSYLYFILQVFAAFTLRVHVFPFCIYILSAFCIVGICNIHASCSLFVHLIYIPDKAVNSAAALFQNTAILAAARDGHELLLNVINYINYMLNIVF